MLALLAPLALAVGQGRCSPERPSPAVGNAVLVVLDDVGHDDLIGLPLPNLDALAAQGTTYSRAYAAPVCSQARRALWFGEFTRAEPGAPCAPPDGNEPPASALALPEVLPVPVALFGKWHLGGDPSGGPWELAPQAHGFHAWRAGIPSNVKGCLGNSYENWIRVEDGASMLSTAYQPDVQLERFSSWWAEARGPKVAVLSLQLAHAPFHTPPAHLLPPGYETFGLSTRQKYEAMIVAADTILGEVLARVDLSTDWVIVVGDNGTPASITPPPWQGRSKGTTFERGIRVPLVAAGPGFMAAASSDALVHAVDIYATLAQAYGSPWGGDGLPLQDTQGHEYVISGKHDDVCVRTPDLKLRRLQDGSEELYDLLEDSLELEDRIDDPAYASEVAELRLVLDEFEGR